MATRSKALSKRNASAAKTRTDKSRPKKARQAKFDPTNRPKSSGFRPNPKVSQKSANDKAPVSRVKRDGHRPLELPPMMLECCPNDNYALLDSGDGQKLERYGDFILQRPEAQAIWSRQRSEAEWAAADAIFTGGSDDDSDGRWHFPKKKLHETWRMTCDGLPYLGRFTAFRHVGVFAEQIVHWRHMRELIEGSDRQLKVLNLFGYTGLASLIAADAGAHVTHVDASKKAIGWARENQDLAGLNERPIRWICEDALKFVQREIRRGNTYDIILADPPAYGRGPNGEVWQLFENLGALVDGCRDILSTQPSMFVLTTYAIRASFFAAHELVMDAFTGFTPHGEVQSGELILREERTGRGLSTSMYTRWTPLTETAKS